MLQMFLIIFYQCSFKFKYSKIFHVKILIYQQKLSNLIQTFLQNALYSKFNRSLETTSIFPPSMKLANARPVHKKGNRSEEDNYRPVSILPNLSKIFERCIYNQIAQFFEKILSKYQCGFRQGHSAQHCLIALLEKWKESVDQEHVFGALLTDLSKAFDCLPHNCLIAKLNAYGFDKRP